MLENNDHHLAWAWWVILNSIDLLILSFGKKLQNFQIKETGPWRVLLIRAYCCLIFTSPLCIVIIYATTPLLCTRLSLIPADLCERKENPLLFFFHATSVAATTTLFLCNRHWHPEKPNEEKMSFQPLLLRRIKGQKTAWEKEIYEEKAGNFFSLNISFNLKFWVVISTQVWMDQNKCNCRSMANIGFFFIKKLSPWTFFILTSCREVFSGVRNGCRGR